MPYQMSKVLSENAVDLIGKWMNTNPHQYLRPETIEQHSEEASEEHQDVFKKSRYLSGIETHFHIHKNCYSEYPWCGYLIIKAFREAGIPLDGERYDAQYLSYPENLYNLARDETKKPGGWNFIGKLDYTHPEKGDILFIQNSDDGIHLSVVSEFTPQIKVFYSVYKKGIIRSLSGNVLTVCHCNDCKRRGFSDNRIYSRVISLCEFELGSAEIIGALQIRKMDHYLKSPNLEISDEGVVL